MHRSSPSSLLTLCWYCMTPGISWSCKKSAKMMSADDNAAIEAEIAAVLEQELTEIAVVQNDANHNEDIICEETENQVEAIVEQVTPPEETNNAVGETAVTKSVEQEAAAAVTAVVVTCEESIQEKTQEESKVLGEAADVEEVKEPEPEPEEERAASQPVQEAENVMVVEEVVTLDQQSALQEESQQEQVTDEMQVDKEAAEQVESITAESVSPSIEQSQQQQQQQPAEVENSTDGPRAKHLKQALRKALNNTIKSCSGDKLESCFPFNLKAHQMSAINSTIIKCLQSVIEGVQVPFEELIVKEGLTDKLNKVDEFTRSRAPDAPSTDTAASLAALTPQNLIDRRLYATKLAALNQLEQHLKKIEDENTNLANELNARQSAFAERLDRLKSSQQLLDLALDQVSKVPMEEMESLVDKMNHQYQPGVISLPKIKLTE